jgi:hypothetical protein
MTIHRQPGTLESLLFREICQRPPLRLEEFTGVSVDVFTKNSNPNNNHHLCAMHAPNLDVALVADGRAPAFVPWMTKQFERGLEDAGLVFAPAVNDRLEDMVLEITSDVGRLCDAVRFAVDPKGASGRKVNTRERDTILSALEELKVKISQAERSVDAACEGATVTNLNTKEAS